MRELTVKRVRDALNIPDILPSTVCDYIKLLDMFGFADITKQEAADALNMTDRNVNSRLYALCKAGLAVRRRIMEVKRGRPSYTYRLQR